MLIRHAHLDHYQYQLNDICEERLKSALEPFPGRLRAFPHTREYWAPSRDCVTSGFREYIDAYIADPIATEKANIKILRKLAYSPLTSP